MATVLIVDDQGETGHLLARVLNYMGHQGIHVFSGPDALDYVHRNIPDVVVLDYMMPGMNGLQVLRELRRDPRTYKLPVIMFSANNDPELVESAIDAGASDFWVKATVAVEEMDARLSRWLKRPLN
jgi:CheY-like chemotaxis protein